jgi:hypothetical protein
MTQSGLADLYKRLWFFWGERGSRIGVLQLPLADQLFLRAALVMRLAEAHMCVTGHAELGADGKDYVPTQCTPPFPKISTPSAPLRERGSAVASLGQINGETPMKSLVSMIVALGIAVAFTAPTFAADKAPTTKADCEKAKMKWDDAAKKCS